MLNSILGDNISLWSLGIIFSSSVILGLIIAFTHKITGKYNKNFLISLTIIPLMVAAIILAVNGSLGTGIAVAGAFSLIRFRSVPGTSKEILSILTAMTAGLVLGTGYISYGVIIVIVYAIMLLLFSNIKIFDNNDHKILKILVPENLDYSDIFKDEFDIYLNSYEINQVKTTNMGSLFEITYLVNIKNNINEKEFIDKLRIKNGNLKINLSKPIEENTL